MSNKTRNPVKLFKKTDLKEVHVLMVTNVHKDKKICGIDSKSPSRSTLQGITPQSHVNPNMVRRSLSFEPYNQKE